LLIAHSLAVAIHVELVERARRHRLAKLLIVAACRAWLGHAASVIIEAVGIHVALIVAVLRTVNRPADDRACTIMRLTWIDGSCTATNSLRESSQCSCPS
jgi:hypothetical protein